MEKQEKPQGNRGKHKENMGKTWIWRPWADQRQVDMTLMVVIALLAVVGMMLM